MARSRPGPRGAPAPGLPAPAPTPLPTFPPPAKPARSNANTSHPAARSAAHAGRTPSLPAGSAAGAGTAWPRGLGLLSPLKSPHLGVPWDPAKPGGLSCTVLGSGPAGMGQVSPSCFSETPMTQRTPHSRLAPTPGPASPRPPAPDTPGPPTPDTPRPPTLGWQRTGAAPNEPLPPNRHKETILGDPDGKGRARARMRRGSRKCSPEAPAGSPAGTAGPPIQPPVSVPRGLSVPKGGRGTESPGHIPAALEEQDVSFPSSVPPPQHSWAEEPGEGRAEAVGLHACHPWKAGAAMWGGRKCRSISRKPPCPAAASPKAGEGMAAPRPPRRPQRKRLSSPRAPEAA